MVDEYLYFLMSTPVQRDQYAAVLNRPLLYYRVPFPAF
jgi:hypothetical protein